MVEEESCFATKTISREDSENITSLCSEFDQMIEPMCRSLLSLVYLIVASGLLLMGMVFLITDEKSRGPGEMASTILKSARAAPRRRKFSRTATSDTKVHWNQSVR